MSGHYFEVVNSPLQRALTKTKWKCVLYFEDFSGFIETRLDKALTLWHNNIYDLNNFFLFFSEKYNIKVEKALFQWELKG